MPAIAARDRPPGLRLLLGLLAAAVVVSIVHYVDNVANYADYPQPDSALSPSRGLIAVSWFAFTAAGAYGLWSYLQGRTRPAAAGLAVYSLSGLVGIGHYTVEGAGGMPAWRHAHVVADILCGLAVFAFAVWVARRGAAQDASASLRT